LGIPQPLGGPGVDVGGGIPVDPALSAADLDLLCGRV
jgi:hypothetical protein